MNANQKKIKHLLSVKRVPNKYAFLLALKMALYFQQIYQIQSQPVKNDLDKIDNALSIVDVTLSLANELKQLTHECKTKKSQIVTFGKIRC